MLSRDVIRVDLDVSQAGKVRAENAADGAAANDADFYAHAVFRDSSPV
jgi:hypothetical protein